VLAALPLLPLPLLLPLLGHLLESVAGLLREGARHDGFELGRGVRPQAPQRRRRDVLMLAEELALTLALERRPSGEHLEEDAAERVDIGAVIDLAGAAALLGRHVRRRSDHQAAVRLLRRRLVPEQLGDAEVEHDGALAALHLLVADEHDVIGLEIAVDDAARVGGGQR
jgi:hypothetical protein